MNELKKRIRRVMKEVDNRLKESSNIIDKKYTQALKQMSLLLTILAESDDDKMIVEKKLSEIEKYLEMTKN